MQTQDEILIATLDANFVVGQKITIFAISSMMAHTVKSEVTVTKRQAPELKYGYGEKGYRLGVLKYRGKRKEYYLTLSQECLVFEGWDLPIKIDSEIPSDGISFSGNACFNLAGDKELIREYVEKRALVPVTDTGKAKILIVPTDAQGRRIGGYDDGELLYPEIDTHHAVVNRIKEKRAEAEQAA
jgi:hypothetical protein